MCAVAAGTSLQPLRLDIKVAFPQLIWICVMHIHFELPIFENFHILLTQFTDYSAKIRAKIRESEVFGSTSN